MSNMELWRKVCVTDPKAVKPITGKPYKGSSPKPYWLIEQATEVFGPVGIGWGVTVKSERFERLSDTDVLHVAVVSVWYVWDGKRSETFDQMGGTKAAYKTNSGSMMIDEDAGKKSVTDGMVKCLSMIGFAGDIFAGRWDDSKYVQDAAAEWERRKREDNPERLQWIADWCAAIDSAANSEELKATYRDAIASAKEMNDADAEGQFMAARATRIAKAKAQPQKEAA